MEDLNDKTTGGNLTAAQWNQPMSEVQNVIENLGIALSAGDLNQLGKAVAGYVANGNHYTDGGAADAYVLTQIGLKQASTAYTDGMIIEFIPANTNAGSSTVNVASLGVKNISDTSSGNEIQSGTRISMRYNGTSGEFEIFQTAAAPVTPGFISGLGVAKYSVDLDHDIVISIGNAADSTDAFLLPFPAATVKEIDSVWAAGAFAGGLFSGTVANNTNYHIFIIRKDSDGTVDAGFDTSITAVNIPAGYTAFRRLGYLKTDGSANIDTVVGVNEGGKVVQEIIKIDGALATGTTLIPNDNSIPQNTEGDQYLELSIIPTDIRNQLEIDSVLQVMNDSASQIITSALFQDSIANALAAGTVQPSAVSRYQQAGLIHRMEAAVTSEITFKIRAGGLNTGTTTVNGLAAAAKLGGVLSSFIRIREVKP